MTRHVWYSAKWDVIYLEGDESHYWWRDQVIKKKIKTFIYLGEL
jgi:hypothetical protein